MKQTGKLWLLVLCVSIAGSMGCKKSTDSASSVNSGPTVTDYDGNVYHTITIGSQVWMLENLRVKHYSNGDPVQAGTLLDLKVTDTSGTFWAYDNNLSYVGDYGLLYNYYAINDARSIAPPGWHIPTDAEWGALVASLGGDYYYVLGDTVAGGKLKEAGNDHWGLQGYPSTNVGATNSSRFTGRPGGILYQGVFEDLRDFGAWWATTSATGVQKDEAYEMVLSYNTKGAGRGLNFKASGLSARCIKNPQPK